MLNEEKKIVTDQSNIDVTDMLEKEIRNFIKKNPYADLIILKSKSPSCGLGTTPILDVDKNILNYTNGLAADIFLENFDQNIIFDENSYET